ncbi:hypothetical protein ACR820_19810 [Streptomyces netropsis]
MSTAPDYRAERRADDAARAEQRRLDARAADERRAERERAADERAERLREQRRAERARRRAERAEHRGQALTPRNVYRTGTLALVVASGLASLPAQIIHFVQISPMLLPMPFSLEGAAWVMAAGVAYADERKLSGGVRWLLRVFVLAAAGFAAAINYTYGVGLGLAAGDARVAGVGLAAVTLLGPLLFEIRQWVCTLAAHEDDGDGREQRRHSRARRWHHRPVVRIANRLMSAAPHGSVAYEDAWARAWQIHTGTTEPGMTPDLHRRAVASAADLAAVLRPPTPEANAEEMDEVVMDRSTSDLEESAPGPMEQSTDPSAFEPAPGPESDADPVPLVSVPVRAAVAAESARPRRATGRVPEVARSPRPTRTADELLDEARSVTADWPDTALTADAIRKAVRTSADKARGLRDTLRAERAAAPEGAEASA